MHVLKDYIQTVLSFPAEVKQLLNREKDVAAQGDAYHKQDKIACRKR